MNRQRSKFAALLLNVVPGLGHLYWGRRVRSFLYFLSASGIFGIGLLVAIDSYDNESILICSGLAFFIWCVSMFDLVGAVMRGPTKQEEQQMREAYYAQSRRMRETQAQGYYDYAGGPSPRSAESMGIGEDLPPHMEFGADDLSGYPPYPPPIGQGHMLREPEYFSDSQRFFTILLSFVPGLGHLYMGLMLRGISFLAAFFGLATVLLFITGFTGEETFLLFLGVLPVIWIYGMFDAVLLAERKRRGEPLRDFSLIEKWDIGREGSGKSRTMGLLLAIVPGASHMYLGLMKRGSQFMIFFFGSIYVLDVLGMSLFLFLVPLIWFYSFFDALQQVGRYGSEALQDRPLIANFEANRTWVGVVLVLLGLYYVFNTIVMPGTRIGSWSIWVEIKPYTRNAIVALLLIGGGFKLLKDSKASKIE
ncbi:hypothetical protein CDO73_15840 [Saccharibacillus sp. O23]|uniref:DUF6677 family protein n=1 Tax=Saccharibacillus sp. O23 TaxID=2009338 RepID=UPI000B4E2475|nr:DUF6677 family protein [Saccharibacillus sp. O23]OWR29137.1 hypothetical protein CDO73_15840 [Saccharibacillus sp. O23]